MIDYLFKRPMLFCALGCTILSVCAFYSEVLLLAVSVFAVFCLSVFIIKGNGKFIVATLLLLLVGIICFKEIIKIKDLSCYNGQTEVVKAVFCETAYKSETVYESYLEIVESENLKKGTKIALWHTPKNIKVGQMVEAKITLREIEDQYKKMSYCEGIYLTASTDDLRVVSEKDDVLYYVHKIRNYIKNTLFSNMKYDSAVTACALVFGDREYFSEDFYNNVKGAGVAHVMVVSGMHLAIMVNLALNAVEKIMFNRWLRAVTMGIVVFFLCALCGFTMSILRAGVTYIIMAAGLIFNRPYSGENALGFAVSLILLWSPFAIFSVAFQLSVLSTFGILAVALPINKYVENRGIIKCPALRFTFVAVVISLSALVFTLPVTIKIFGYVSNMSLITNLLISVPVSFGLSFMFAGLLVSTVSPFLAKPIFLATDLILQYVNNVINYFGSLENSLTHVPEYGTYIAVGVILLIFHVLSACKKRSDMLKLRKMIEKINQERGRRSKWQSFMRKD